MCGHLGVVGTIGATEKAAYKQLLQVGTLRGPHSAGTYFKNRNEEIGSTYHAIGYGHDLTDYKEFAKEFDGAKDLYVILGHNRWATQGHIDLDNAHPFSYGDISGAHNGTVPEHYWSRLVNGGKESIDSKALIKSISVIGAKKTLQEIPLGAWCLIWFNEADHTINFVRNNERDLYLCTSNNGKTLWWASESMMLYWILGRNGIKIDANSMMQLPIDKHMSLTIPEVNQSFWLPVVEDAPCKSFTYSPKVNVLEDYTDYLPYRSNRKSYYRGDSKFTYFNGKTVPWEAVEQSYDTHGSCCQSCGIVVPKYSIKKRDNKYFFPNLSSPPVFVCGSCWEDAPDGWREWMVENLTTDLWAKPKVKTL